MNGVTLTRFYHDQQEKNGKLFDDDFLKVLTAVQIASKSTSSLVRRAGLEGLNGVHGEVNVQGEAQKKLDVVSNQLFIEAFKSTRACSHLVSEENDEIIACADKTGKYLVTFDPLDGSSNIDCLVSIGTIFGVFKRDKSLKNAKETLTSAKNLVASGYCLYGSATQMVIASADARVNGFMLDSNIGEFLLVDEDMKIPPEGNIYAINEGYESQWLDPGIKDYVKACKRSTYSARYTGSMVADIHRTIKYGGIFIYPATKDAKDGKLRILYECLPMAHIVEAAGGSAYSENRRTLELKVDWIHDRAPIVLGSKLEVEKAMKYLNNNNNNITK